MKKVAIIIDNPLRDLEGLVLLAASLATKHIEVYLIGMYDQDFDVIANNIDLVVFNYLRKNNVERFKRFKKKGIKVGVLDTEGAGEKDDNAYANVISQTGLSEYLDFFCCWGSGQYKALLKRRLISKERLFETGNPRYDFCSQKYTSFYISKNIKDFSLINTNFPLANRKFSNNEQAELNNFIKIGYSKDAAKFRLSETKKTFLKMKEFLKELIEQFQNESFVLRPHPFEDSKPYSNLLVFDNVSLNTSGSSMRQISNCKNLIHLNCLTSIEAFMMNKKALSPAWISSKELEVPLAQMVSINFSSKEDFFEHFLDISTKTRDLKKDFKIRNEIEKRFHKIDGKANQRVCDAILAALKMDLIEIRDPKISIFSRLKDILVLFLGYRSYFFIYNLFVEKKNEDSKSFRHAEVKNILDKLKDINDHFGGLTCDFPNTDIDIGFKSRLSSNRAIKIFKR